MAKKTYSGNINLRISPALHAHLAALAEKEGRSLNQVMAEFLAGASSFKAKK